jgi:hypothetical protein
MAAEVAVVANAEAVDASIMPANAGAANGIAMEATIPVIIFSDLLMAVS